MKRHILGLLIAASVPAVASAQTPAAPAAPAIRVGVTIFTDYTVTERPKTIDSNGDDVTLNAFNLTRAYLNIFGTITPRISFRLTPDIVRNTDAGSLSGNLVFRLKYAYAQIRAGNDTIVRLGIQQTPMIDGQEGVYRYRFQGTPFAERDGGLSSADSGLTVMTPLPGGYGDVHIGVYNGEGYTRPEVNDRKALMMRATVKPMPNHDFGKGLRLIGYYHADSYLKDAPRTRAAGSVMFEHAWLNAGADYLQRVDQPTSTSAEVTGKGFSFFVTPFFDEKGKGLEGLLRFDSFDPNTNIAGKRQRLIAGVAYWFPRVQTATATAAVLAHMEQVRATSPNRTTDRRYTLNALIMF